MGERVMSDSYIVYNAQGNPTAFVGYDATSLYRAQSLRFALKMYQRVKILPSRGITLRSMLDLAEGITQKKYKRTQIQQAIDDVGVWCDNMKLALPTVDA
jgi:hypothetical protein